MIHQVIEFPGMTPAELYATYTDSARHAAAIGAPVDIEPRPDTPFTAFGEMSVRGTTLAVVPDRLVVQTWRGTVWHDDDPDSILILVFLPTENGARIELLQTGVPLHALDVIARGWHSLYWSRWRQRFTA